MKIHNACVTQPITRKTVTHALCNTADYTSKLHNPVTHRLCNTKHFLCNTIGYTIKLHNTSYTPVTHSVQSNSACYSLCFVAVYPASRIRGCGGSDGHCWSHHHPGFPAAPCVEGRTGGCACRQTPTSCAPADVLPRGPGP